MSEQAETVVLSDGRSRVVLHRPQSRGVHGFEHWIELVGGPFQGSLEGSAYMDPYRDFHDDLAKLHQTLSGEVTLDGYENFGMTLRGDGLGHIQVEVSANPQTYPSVHLEFEMLLDQTQLPAILASLKRAFLTG
jgi:hypothetical protein